MCVRVPTWSVDPIPYALSKDVWNIQQGEYAQGGDGQKNEEDDNIAWRRGEEELLEEHHLLTCEQERIRARSKARMSAR